jgi:toxin-antitoxin system PIN domain toxin
MVHLLDVNLLVSLAWPNHVHHAAARRWFSANAPQGWATCPITECGFVRISCNPRAVVAAVSPRQAVDALLQMAAYPDHVFWPDDVMFADGAYIPHGALKGHQQVTDAYLLGLAFRHGGVLATLDRGLPGPLPQVWRHSVAVVPT